MSLNHPETIPTARPPDLEKLSSTKIVPGAKKVGNRRPRRYWLLEERGWAMRRKSFSWTQNDYIQQLLTATGWNKSLSFSVGTKYLHTFFAQISKYLLYTYAKCTFAPKRNCLLKHLEFILIHVSSLCRMNHGSASLWCRVKRLQ